MTEVRTTSEATLGLDGLVDALDRLLAQGAAVMGDVIISVAGIDLIRLDLRALLASVATTTESAR